MLSYSGTYSRETFVHLRNGALDGGLLYEGGGKLDVVLGHEVGRLLYQLLLLLVGSLL